MHDARLAAAGAELLGLGQVVDDLAAFEVFGQGGSGRASSRRLAGLSSPRLAAAGPAFGAAAEAVLQGGVELAAQLGVLGAQPGAPRRAAARTIACSVGTSSGSGASGVRVVASMPD